MSKSNMISGLRKSTKITVIICACFLALVAVILLFLMIFPLDPKKDEPTAALPATENTTETAAVQTEAPSLSTEEVHTLSTWLATGDGETKPIGEEYGDEDPTEALTDPIVTETEVYLPPEETMTETSVVTDVFIEPTESMMESSTDFLESFTVESIASETVYTETIAPSETVPEEPIATDPTEPEIPVETVPQPELVETTEPPLPAAQ